MTSEETPAGTPGGHSRWKAATRYAVVLGAAFCAAFLLTEVIVADIVGFPRRPRNRLITVCGEASRFGSVAWEQPYTSIWNVEGGNIVVQLNNVGLPGCDVVQGPQSRYILVLGSSYVEGYQLHRQLIATSIFQEKLREEHPGFQVINLGYSSADPYISYFRARFFETQFPPSCVVLVVESFYADWLRRHKRPLDFSLPADFGKAAPVSAPMRIFRFLREKSATVNIFSVALSENRIVPVDQADPKKTVAMQPAPPEAETVVPAELESCLKAYHEHYASRFVVVMMLPKKEEETLLAERCRALGISSIPASEIRRPENRFGGRGHLNAQGNRELGGALYRAFLETAHAGAGVQP